MPKKNQGQTPTINHLETIKNLPNELSSSLVNDVAKSGADDFFRQLLGADLGLSSSKSPDKQVEKSSADKNKGLVFDAKSHQGSKAELAKAKNGEKMGAKPERAAAIDYHRDIVRSSERASKMEVRSIDQKIQQITIELRKLINSSKILQMEFAEVSVEQTPTNVGEYHVNFFDWMLIMIQNARAKVEDSGAWLQTVQGKGKGKKGGGYWGMFKKHGTSFGLSGERTVATQTG